MCKAVPIKKFPDYYITDSGLVYSRNPYKNRDGRIKRIKTVQRKTGYINVGLNRNNKHFVLPLHRLVAMAFVPNPDNKPEVNHINGVKHDNRADNLEWVTHSENIKHSYTTLGKKRNPHFNVYRKWVACIKDGKILDKFHGTREASRQTGIRQARISECCLGKTKHAGGFQWEYIDGDWKDSLMECGKMNENLKPYDRKCPNCDNGGKSEALCRQEKENIHGHYFRVVCLSCGATSKWKKI